MSKQVDNKNHKWRTLLQFSESLVSGIRLQEDEILNLIRTQAKKLMDTDNMYIALYEETTNIIRFGLAYEDGKPKNIPSRKTGKGRTEEIINTKQPLFHATRMESKKWYAQPGHKEYVGNPYASWIGVPMIVGKRIIGVIATFHPTRDYVYSNDDLEFLQAMANQAAIALDNASLYQEARSDAIAAKQIATLGTAIAALQHRINNTLNIIIPNIRRLRNRINVDDPTIKEILDIIERNTRYTSDILMRIQTPLQEVESSSVNVNSLLSDIAGTAKKEWGNNSSHPAVKIKLNLDDSIPLIQVPVGQIYEIIRNLMDNAYRAMKKGGKLIISSKMENNSICIRFKDTAEGGIPPIVRERLFQKPVPSREPGHGAGLGLWLGKLMLQSIGGDVRIEETSVSGTTMLLQIPASKAGKDR